MLKDRVALITGAASIKGIGFGIAKKFAENGCNIILNDIREPNKELLNEIKSFEKRGLKCHFVMADVSNSKQVSNLIEVSLSKFGRIDVLVNNAAFAPHPKNIIDIAEEEWDKVLAVNLKAAFLLCKEVTPHMKKINYGKIINISAVSGLSPIISDVHYNSSKAALIMLTKDLALEFAPFNVNVNCICPGLIVTELTESIAPGRGEEKRVFFEAFAKSNIPMQRAGYPENIANAALFFASDLSSYVTGEVLAVAGGVPLFRTGLPK